jgi:hypothetical protein
MNFRLLRGKGGKSIISSRADLSVIRLCNISRAVSVMIDCISVRSADQNVSTGIRKVSHRV